MSISKQHIHFIVKHKCIYLFYIRFFSPSSLAIFTLCRFDADVTAADVASVILLFFFSNARAGFVIVMLCLFVEIGLGDTKCFLVPEQVAIVVLFALFCHCFWVILRRVFLHGTWLPITFKLLVLFSLLSVILFIYFVLVFSRFFFCLHLHYSLAVLSSVLFSFTNVWQFHFLMFLDKNCKQYEFNLMFRLLLLHFQSGTKRKTETKKIHQTFSVVVAESCVRVVVFVVVVVFKFSCWKWSLESGPKSFGSSGLH